MTHTKTNKIKDSRLRLDEIASYSSRNWAELKRIIEILGGTTKQNHY